MENRRDDIYCSVRRRPCRCRSASHHPRESCGREPVNGHVAPAIRAADDDDSFVGRATSQTLPRTAEKLAANQPVKIVCLGDSVTGIYYHTGGRRAYPEMLAVALKMQYPQADVTVINAGISGHSTVDGLQRLQKDVLDHKPDLVTVMFALNDMVRVPIPEYQANSAESSSECLCRRGGIADHTQFGHRHTGPAGSQAGGVLRRNEGGGAAIPGAGVRYLCSL